MSSDVNDAVASPALQARLDAAGGRALIVGLAGLGVTLLGALVFPSAAMPAYLVAVLLWTGVCLGSIGFTLLHHVVGGGWGVPLRRPMEAAASLIVLMALLFLPVVIGLKSIYAWTDPAVVEHHKVVDYKVNVIHWLTPTNFALRAYACFAIWTVVAFVLIGLSKQQDARGDDGPTRRLYAISGPLIVLMFLSTSLAAFDWGMSLDPDWYSTIYGVIYIVGSVLSTLALMILAITRMSDVEPMRTYVTPGRLNDLGNLMLAFTMLWAYTSFSQFLITWQGNIPEEVVWFDRRIHNAWGVVALCLIAFHFFAPFLALLTREYKRKGEWLASVATWILVFRVVDVSWNVLPSRQARGEEGFPWLSVLFVATSVVGVGGIWIAAFTRRLKSAPLIPLHDSRVIAALEHPGEPVI